MPYMVVTRDDKFCVYKEEDGKPQGETLGCHESEEDAQSQIETIHASEGEATLIVASSGTHEWRIEVNRALQLLTAISADADPQNLVPWESDALMYVGIPTDDGRLLRQGGHRDLPLPLLAQTATDIGHNGAYIVGRIDAIEIPEEGPVTARGVIDPSLPGAEAVLQMLHNGMLTGVSVDLGRIDSVESEVTETDPDGEPVAWLDIFTGFEIAGATLVAIPAFRDSRIRLVESVEASGIPVDPPLAWFEDPELSGRTRLTITDEGRIYGHLAPWGECHIGITARCQEAPRSATSYAWFALGTMRCAEGCRIPIGTIVMDTGHASKTGLTARAAASHYDNTGTAVADIAIGEDEHGIWVAGAVRSDITPERLRSLRAARLSGDWRPINGHLELVAILAVNTGGFPIWEEAVAADGSVESLVASIEIPSNREVAIGLHQPTRLPDLALTELAIDGLVARVHR